jgi:hypothetical protein
LVTNVAKKLPPETLRKALDLEARLWTHARIADDLGIARETVTRYLSKHRHRVYDKLAGRHAAIRARQAAQLEHMADEAYQGWERSKLDAVTVKVTTGGDQEGDTPKTERTTKSQAGDTSFLSEARALLAEVRKTLGIKDAVLTDDGWPAAGSDEVTAALEMLQRIEDKRRGEQPKTPAESGDDDQDDDDQDDDEDGGRRGQGCGQDR